MHTVVMCLKRGPFTVIWLWMVSPLVADSTLLDHLDRVATAYATVTLHGTYTWERLYPIDHQETQTEEIEFQQQNRSQRLIIRPPDPGVHERVYVADPGISFQCERRDDGRDVMLFLSPRRGIGEHEVRMAINLKAFLCMAPCGLASDSITELIRQKRIDFGEPEFLAGEPARVRYQIKRYRPSPEILTTDSAMDYMDGWIQLLTEPIWRIDELQLHCHYKDQTPENLVHVSVSYSDVDGALPRLARAQLTGSLTSGELTDRHTLDVRHLDFSAIDPIVFTTSGSGLTIIDTSQSSTPSLVWYASLVATGCLVLLLFLRARRDRTTPTTP
jgi:hypothetical protein